MKDTVNGARGLGLDSQDGQIGYSRANGLPVATAVTFFGAVLPRR